MTDTADELAPARAYIENLVGRPLRLAEQVIDIPKLDHAMNRAKDDLEQAIRDEMHRATRAWIRGQRRPRLQFTPAMRKPLHDLYALGRREARRELARIGVPARALAAPSPDPRKRGLDPVFDAVRKGLPGITVRIQRDLVAADLSEMATAAIARELMKIPGARDIASRVVSTALYSGMGATFEEHADLVGGWEYTAVMDAGTCEECEPLDGEQFESWEAIQDVLPDGGPNPLCLGEGRCRCRAVPVG